MSHPTSSALTVFKSYVEGKTNGEIEVQLYPSGQLGDAKSMIEQVSRGIISRAPASPAA